ncbi:MAG: hypothetical protein ABSG25_08655 [Bryobacteraceae bacterium]
MFTRRNAMQGLLAGLTLSLSLAVPASASPFWAQVPKINLTAQNLDWEDIATEAYEQPTATAAALPGPGMLINQIHVFFRDANKCLQHFEGTDRGQDFMPLPTPLPCDSGTDGPMTAIAWDNSGRIDLFWFNGTVGTAGTHASLMHRWTDGTNWYNENLGSTATTPASSPVASLAAAPAVASWGTGHLDIFWRDTGNQVRWLGFDRSEKGKPGYTSGGWFDKERVVQSNVTGNPTAVERTANIIDLFWLNSSGYIEHEYTGNGGTAWSGILSLNVAANSAPSATSWGSNRIDVVYGVDNYNLGHLWIDGGTGTWNPSHETLVSSSQPVGVPVAAAAPSHSGRMDVFTSPAGTRLSHTLYQESLPGFVPVGEGNNGGNGLWCWASAAITVVDYIAHPNPSPIACDGANKEIKMTTCCTNPVAPQACLIGGTVQPVLNAYGVTYTDVAPLDLAGLRKALWVMHQPVISSHHHPEGGGHFVDLVDTYRLHGTDMVVIFGTQFDANWVVPYSDYLRKYYSWWVDGMVTNFSK